MKKDTPDKDGLNILQRAGISRTPQRLAVLNILLQSAAPLNISCVRELLASKKRIDRVTVYRIISLFKQHGIIREITSKAASILSKWQLRKIRCILILAAAVAVSFAVWNRLLFPNHIS
jgi:Fe2+/Zn2+ uptake regulation proteins